MKFLEAIADSLVSIASPTAAVKRKHARSVARSYLAGEGNRLNAHENPKNLSADSEAQGPFGADAARAWARMLIRDNPYAFAALEAITSETMGVGFGMQSALETSEGQDEEDTNENRDKTFSEWAEVCDINGQLTFDEIQVLAFREMVEAGECLIRFHTVPRNHKGIYRPVPLAMELVEADRLANDYDTYAFGRDRTDGVRITRGVEMDAHGRPLAYWVYPAHPSEPDVFRRTPERVPAKQIKHLFRTDRVGQSRGVTWFAPAIEPLRTLGTYKQNEMQRSAVQSCFVAAIKTESALPLGNPPSNDTSTSDANGNNYQYIQPGQILNLRPGESMDFGNPSSPNSGAGSWISLMIQGIAAGIGTSYESVSKDFSNTSYSSARTSKLENRPRYRRWQQYQKHHVCVETWDRFCTAAAHEGRKEFPSMQQLLEDRRVAAPIEVLLPEWEWVDLIAEQQSNESAVAAHQKSGTDVLGSMGKNYKHVQRKIAQEKAYRNKLAEQFSVDMSTTAESKQTGELSKDKTADAAKQTAGAAQTAADAKSNPPAKPEAKPESAARIQRNEVLENNIEAKKSAMDHIKTQFSQDGFTDSHLDAVFNAQARMDEPDADFSQVIAEARDILNSFVGSSWNDEATKVFEADLAKKLQMGLVELKPQFFGRSASKKKIARDCGTGKGGFKPGNDCSAGGGGGGLTSSQKKQVKSAEFKNWFKGSKIKNENGEPTQAFHGFPGSKGDFTEFSKNEIGEQTGKSNTGGGFWFTDNQKYADQYGYNYGEYETAIKPVYLKAENPLEYDYKSKGYFDPREVKKAVDAATAGGHDGVVFKNWKTSGPTVTTYLVFEPTQIKSSIGNAGKFDPDDPNILRDCGTGKGGFKPGNSCSGGGGGSKEVKKWSEKKFKNPEHAKNFQEWFGDSKAVDENGEPIVLFHGTNSQFKSFQVGGGNPEGDLGAGIYLTNSVGDVGENYAGMGPDMTNRVEQKTEQIVQEMLDGFALPEDVTHDEFLELSNDEQMSLASVVAMEELNIDHGGAMIPAYVKLTKPVVIGGPKETVFDYEGVYEDAAGLKSGQTGFDESTEEWVGETGSYVEFVEKLKVVSQDYHDIDIHKALESVEIEDGIGASELMSTLKTAEGMSYASDDEGRLVASDILAQAFEAMGHDGFVDNTVNDKFGSGLKVGKPMEGMDADTVHYIVFNPAGIKSSIGNKGNFDPDDKNITHEDDPNILRDCGTGDGGFKAGNDCAGGGGDKSKPVRFEAGKKLTKDEKSEVLKNLGDVYKDAGLKKDRVVGFNHDGDPVMGYPIAPEHFVKSDITGKKIRNYVTLPDGTKAHPTELFPNLTPSDINAEKNKQVYDAEMSERAKAGRNSRIAKDDNKATYEYFKSRRQQYGSFLAANEDGHKIKVDGSDPADIAHFESSGFFQTSAPVTLGKSEAVKADKIYSKQKDSYKAKHPRNTLSDIDASITKWNSRERAAEEATRDCGTGKGGSNSESTKRTKDKNGIRILK